MSFLSVFIKPREIFASHSFQCFTAWGWSAGSIRAVINLYVQAVSEIQLRVLFTHPKKRVKLEARAVQRVSGGDLARRGLFVSYVAL